MHELSVVDSILKVVLKHAAMNGATKVVAVGLRIGELSDLQDEWVQHYFDYLSKDTVAAGAIVKIERTPVVCRCESCSEEFPVDPRGEKKFVCPACGQERATLISGREYFIKNIEVL